MPNHFFSLRAGSLFTLLLAFSPLLPAQSKAFADCISLQAVVFLSGDTINVQCDTVYLLNTLTFKRYDSAYRDLRRRGSGIANLMDSYDELFAVQERRLAEQAKSYEELRMHFLNVSTQAESTIKESSGRLTGAIATMEGLSTDLTETRRLLSEAKEIVESEQRGFNLEKLLWGAGGLIGGLVVGVIIAK